MIRTLIFAVLLVTVARAQQDSPTNAPTAKPPVDARTAKKYLSQLSYQFAPCVFGTKDFPAGSVEPEMAQSVLGPIQVATTFYDEKFEEVKEADAPGRYGAVVHLTLGDGTKLDRFVTLYRIPEGAVSETIKLGKVEVPVETATGPDVPQRQFEELATGMRGGLGTESGSSGFAMLLGVSKVMPGITPDQVLGKFLAFMARDNAWWFELRKKIGLQPSYLYFTQLPEGYEADTAKRWPLVLFLHGSGAIGSSVDQLKVSGVPGGLKSRGIPAILIAPACPDQGWSTPELSALLDEASAKYRVDPDRIIVTGASMGGFGAWALAEAFPDRFAAIVPICGVGNPDEAAKLSKLPIWAFHGQLDTTVPVMMSQIMIAAVQKDGGDPHFTVYPEAKHNSWDQAYATDALYTWMFAQQRGKPEVKTPGLQEP